MKNIKIAEDQKIALFSCYAHDKLYAETDTDYGRYLRGVMNGVTSVLHAMDLDFKDILPNHPPDSHSDVYAGFMASYTSYLCSEKKERLPKDSNKHLMLFGRDAKGMMKEAEKQLKEWEKDKGKKLS